MAQNQPTTVSALGRRSREPFSPKPSSKKTRSERTPRTKKIMPVNFIDKDADVQMYNDDDEDGYNESSSSSESSDDEEIANKKSN